jgi:predicted nucleotidyltransferase
MTPEQLADRLRRDAGAQLKAVVLYGSAAAGDHAGKRSDFNVLVVMEALGMAQLKAISGTAAQWHKEGNPPPLLFTLERLRQSADVFPIELLDMRQSHRVLYGEDVLRDMDLTAANLRVEIEHELRGKLIQLRENFLLTEGKPRRIVDLMIESLSAFLVLFRAALRLYEPDVPARKLEALEALARHIALDTSVFTTISALKQGSKRAREVDAEELFGRYLAAVESIVDAVDAYIRKSGKE